MKYSQACLLYHEMLEVTTEYRLLLSSNFLRRSLNQRRLGTEASK